MKYKEFDSDIVKDWIDIAAERVVDDYDDDDPFSERVYDSCEREIESYWDQIVLCAYYDPRGACTGIQSYEDSPYAQFENDVYNRAKDLLEEAGYDVSQL